LLPGWLPPPDEPEFEPELDPGLDPEFDPDLLLNPCEATADETATLTVTVAVKHPDAAIAGHLRVRGDAGFVHVGDVGSAVGLMDGASPDASDHQACEWLGLGEPTRRQLRGRPRLRVSNRRDGRPARGRNRGSATTACSASPETSPGKETTTVVSPAPPVTKRRGDKPARRCLETSASDRQSRNVQPRFGGTLGLRGRRLRRLPALSVVPPGLYVVPANPRE
jgi:hypothetical protein